MSSGKLHFMAPQMHSHAHWGSLTQSLRLHFPNPWSPALPFVPSSPALRRGCIMGRPLPWEWDRLGQGQEERVLALPLTDSVV